MTQVLRRTGPFPRRRKYRDLSRKKLAVKGADGKFTTLSVRETFERFTVPPGEDATWEEPKAPSALQVRQYTDALNSIVPHGGTGRDRMGVS